MTDRMSSLSDEVIHQILSCLDTRLAVQTSVLSKRWKHIWESLPFLHFDEYTFDPTKDFIQGQSIFEKFVISVFSRRNQRCNIIKLKLRILNDLYWLYRDWIEECLEYAFSHNLEELKVCMEECDLSKLSSKTLKKLKLVINCVSVSLIFSECWDLPALTSLHLKDIFPFKCSDKIPESFLICLPSLTYLCVDRIELPASFAMPTLKTLHLVSCDLPETVWDLPALVSLVLDHVDVPANISQYLSVLVSLQYLRLFSCFESVRDFLIVCPQLLYLELRAKFSTPTPNILIFAPKLCNLTILGIFTITCGASKLENVTIKLRGCFGDETTITWEMLKQYCLWIMFMLPGLGSARTLTLDEDTIEVLSDASGVLELSSSPFYNLKYLKLPQRYKESGSGLSGITKSYLLGGSPGATIVTSYTQNGVIPQIAFRTAQDVMQEEPLAIPTMELADS